MIRCLLLVLASFVAVAPASAGPPALPPEHSPAALLAALPAADREAVLAGEAVVTFAERRVENGRGASYLAISIGALPHSPKAVRGLLARTGAYPAWVPLSPTYKAVRVAGHRRISAEVGRSSSPKTREVLEYAVEHGELGSTWRLAQSKKALEAGSSVGWEAHPHPSRGGHAVVVHRQRGELSGRGRLSNYLDSTDKQGRNRYWKDANKHARRLHWAMDAALSHPPGRDREALYLDRFAAEFNGGTPYWAK